MKKVITEKMLKKYETYLYEQEKSKRKRSITECLMYCSNP